MYSTTIYSHLQVGLQCDASMSFSLLPQRSVTGCDQWILHVVHTGKHLNVNTTHCYAPIDQNKNNIYRNSCQDNDDSKVNTSMNHDYGRHKIVKIMTASDF